LDAVGALRAGRPVLLPTDTVYGLCALADDETAVRALYELKGRGARQPTALVASTVEALLARIPELDERVLRALLPGRYTLVLANPARRYPWLTGARPETIGVRVPDLAPGVRCVLEAAGPVAATSANEPGEPAAASLGEVPHRIRAACGAEVDGGRLPGTASTVIDLSGPEPVVIREGAAPSAEAITRLRR
jgi:L-threonylcarbamoyladenylate synthase